MCMGIIKDFDKLWELAIEPSIKKCIVDVDERFKRECKFTTQELTKYRSDLESMYKRKREWLKKTYLPHDKSPLLDFHKLGAIVCRCLIGYKPFTYDEKKAEDMWCDVYCNTHMEHDERMDWEVSNLYINYKLAFLAAVGIAYVDLLDWASRKRDKAVGTLEFDVYEEFRKALVVSQGLLFYQKPKMHENFENSTIIAIMKSDLLQRDFDYFLFAIILYQIQENTKLRLFGKILPNYNLSLSDIELA